MNILKVMLASVYITVSFVNIGQIKEINNGGNERDNLILIISTICTIAGAIFLLKSTKTQ